MSHHPAAPTLDIADVARETGLGKDSLRAWERRYGFPTPLRNAQGERLYTQDQVDRLRTIQRLLLSGQRPGKVVGLAPEALRALLLEAAPEPVATRQEESLPAQEQALRLLTQGDIAGLRRLLSQAQARLGLASFVTQMVAPLATRIGQAWMDGGLQVYQEHLGMEVLNNALRVAMQALPEPSAQAAPRVLLTTLPGESHGLGLLMAEAMLALEGCHCISLGVQTPIAEIVAAADHYRADVIGLSSAGGLPARRLSESLVQLRARVPASIVLWLGGHGAAFGRQAPQGIETFNDLQAIAPAVHAWRAVIRLPSNAA